MGNRHRRYSGRNDIEHTRSSLWLADLQPAGGDGAAVGGKSSRGGGVVGAAWSEAELARSR